MNDLGPAGVFAGLATLDVISRVSRMPEENEKITATRQFVAAGGPAANAAVTFAALGGTATLITTLGSGQIARMIADELALVGVRVVDVAPELADAASVSSVVVTESTGDRAVIGGDAAAVDAPAPAPGVLSDVLDDADVVLLDGHHPRIAAAVLDAAPAGLPTVLDAGRWKPVMSVLVPGMTDIVASADFRAPGAADSTATAEWILGQGAPVVVTTAGRGPVRWWTDGVSGEVQVPRVDAVDTLGAGDVFHGAYAFAAATRAGIRSRISFAASVAATRCAHVGPRSWLRAIAQIPLDQGDR